MRETEPVNPDDVNLPGVLRGLLPAAPSASVARAIWYRSGYQAGRRQLNLWRGATIGLLLGSTALLGWQQTSHRANDLNRTVVVQAPPALKIPPNAPALSSGAASYARLLDSLMQDRPRPWAEESVPVGNPHTPPESRRSTDGMELNFPPFN